MAKNNPKLDKANRRIQSIASNIQSNMDSLYRTTYFSTPQANNDVKGLAQDINDNIDKIVSRNMDTIGIPSVSVLYSRLFDKSADESRRNVQGMFEEPMMMDDLYATFMSNRFLRELDDEIDTVCKYMPDLEEALDAKKDAVLSADHFSKDFLNIKFPTDIANTQFAQRITELKKKYKLQKLSEDIYDDTGKYGEKFVYIVPYSAAISRLLATKPDTVVQKPYARSESAVLSESQINTFFESSTERFLFTMTESSASIKPIDSSLGGSMVFDKPTIMVESKVNDYSTHKKVSKFEAVPILKESEKLNLGIEINTSGMIDSAIREAVTKNRIYSSRPKSLKESFIEADFTPISEEKKSMPKAAGNLNGSPFKTSFDSSNTTVDGLIGHNEPDDSRFKVNVLGAVVKVLKREFIIPIYIEDSCMGYYYIELRTKDAGNELMGFRNLLGDPLTGMSSDGRANFNNIDAFRQEETMKYVASQLSQFIDKKFINANQDLAKEIYAILKFNDIFNSPSLDLIRVTFVPPEDIHHSYFKLDEESHRGISDLAKGLIPAKLYSSLYVTSAIGIMTRGQDKRVYYVKQTVDTNIAQDLMNVINQIKMGNFGIRQFNSINTILNITGRFNDYVIPTSASGDSPINIDVIQGQQFDINTDFMEQLKEMAINSTGVPLDIVQTRRSVDYASQLSMSSSKFLRTVYKRQERFQEIMGPIISAIYNYEYGENVDLDVSFPPPVFLDMANTNQLINNTKEFVDSCIDVEMQNEQDDELKSRYRFNLFMRYIGTHIDIAAHKSILEQTKVQIKEEQKESEIASAQEPESTEDEGW